MIKKSIFYIAVALLIFGGQFFYNRGLATGTPPMIAQKTLAGRAVMPQIAKGPAIIYFWAEWCGICNMMKDSVDSVLQEFTGVTVAIRSGDDHKIKKYLHQHQLNWQVINDMDGSIAHEYGIRGVPAVFFLNKEGDIVFSSTGYASEMGIRFRLWLADFI